MIVNVDVPLTRDVLMALVDYNPHTGKFYWRRHGAEAGTIKKDALVDGLAYVSIHIGGKQLHAHRLAFLYMQDSLPDKEVDHINGNGLDNRWENLRIASRSTNMRNRRLGKNNKTGILGVYWVERIKKWQASIRNEQKLVYLKSTSDFFEACCARKSAETRYGYHSNHGRETAV